jgi:hypothetical protein
MGGEVDCVIGFSGVDQKHLRYLFPSHDVGSVRHCCEALLPRDPVLMFGESETMEA